MTWPGSHSWKMVGFKDHLAWLQSPHSFHQVLHCLRWCMIHSRHLGSNRCVLKERIYCVRHRIARGIGCGSMVFQSSRFECVGHSNAPRIQEAFISEGGCGTLPQSHHGLFPLIAEIPCLIVASEREGEVCWGRELPP